MLFLTVFLGTSQLLECNMSDSLIIESIEIYSMDLETTSPHDYTPNFFMEMVRKVESSENYSNKKHMKLSQEQVENEQIFIQKILNENIVQRQSIDCRMVVDISCKNGSEFLIAINSAKEATINGALHSKGKSIYRRFSKYLN